MSRADGLFDWRISGVDFDAVARDASSAAKGIEKRGILSVGIEGVIDDVDVAGGRVLGKRDAREVRLAVAGNGTDGAHL